MLLRFPRHQVDDPLRHRHKGGAIGPESEGPQDLICEPTRPLNRVRCSVP